MEASVLAAARRPLASSEELWNRALEMGTGLILLGVRCEKALPLGKIREAAAATAVRFPILGARIVKPAKGKVEFQIWAPPAPVTVEARDFAALPDPGKGADSTGVSDFQRAMEGEFAIPLGGSSNGSTEVFQVHVYSLGAETLVILRMHGGAMDRPSMTAVAQAFLADLNTAVAGHLAPPSWIVEAAPPALPPPMDELLPKSYRAKGLLTKLVDSAGYVAGAKRALLPFEPGCADHKKNAFRTEFLPFSLGPQATEKLLDACARESATLFGAECAAALKAVATFKQLLDKKEDFGVTSIIDCRQYLEPALPPSAVGLYDTGLPMAERVSATMAFWDVARSLSSAAAADVAKGRHFSEIPTLNMLFSQALKHPSLTPESSLRTSVLSGFTDAPQEATWKDVGQLAIRETFGPLASIHGVGPCIALPDLLQDGDLHVTLVYAAPLFSRATMREIASTMKVNLLAAAGV